MVSDSSTVSFQSFYEEIRSMDDDPSPKQVRSVIESVLQNATTRSTKHRVLSRVIEKNVQGDHLNIDGHVEQWLIRRTENQRERFQDWHESNENLPDPLSIQPDINDLLDPFDGLTPSTSQAQSSSLSS